MNANLLVRRYWFLPNLSAQRWRHLLATIYLVEGRKARANAVLNRFDQREVDR